MSPENRRNTNPDQGSFLAPAQAALRAGVVVEVDGGFYPAPSETMSADEQVRRDRLQAESNALLMLDRACRTERNITNMEKHQAALRSGEGTVRPGTDASSELHRLAHLDEKNRPAGAIPTSMKTLDSFKRRAQTAFAKSIGIETVTELGVIEENGVPREIEDVHAKDPRRQVELTRRYAEFRGHYEGSRRSRARERRRAEIAAILSPEPK